MSRPIQSQSTARHRGARRLAMPARLAGVLLAVLVAAPSLASEVVAIRVGRHPTFSRVVFELDRAAGYRVERREKNGSEELIVTLDATSRGRSISSRSEGVSRVEVQPAHGRSVAHIDLRKSGLQLKEMILANPPRIVLDLMLEHPPAPVVAKPTPKPAPKVAKAEPAPKPAPKVAKAEPAPKPAPKVAKAEPAPKPAPKVAKTEPAPKAAPKVAKREQPEPEEIAKGEPRAIMPPMDHLAAEAEASASGEASEVEPPEQVAKAEEPKPEAPKARTPEAGKPVARKPKAMKPKAPTPSAKEAAPSGSEAGGGSGWMAGLTSNPVVLGAAAGVLFVVIGLVLLVLRRRRGPSALDVTAIADGAPEGLDAGADSLFGDSGRPATSLADFFESDGAKDTRATPPQPKQAKDTRATPPQPKQAKPAKAKAEPAPSSETSFAGLFDDTDDSDAAPQRAAATMGDTSMSQATSDLPADRSGRAASAPPAAAGDKDVLRVVHELERRMSQLESKLEEANEARERLERQVAAQSEELRVQRAAIARTQRALRTMSRGDEDKGATEPALRDADTQARTRTASS